MGVRYISPPKKNAGRSTWTSARTIVQRRCIIYAPLLALLLLPVRRHSWRTSGGGSRAADGGAADGVEDTSSTVATVSSTVSPTRGARTASGSERSVSRPSSRRAQLHACRDRSTPMLETADLAVVHASEHASSEVRCTNVRRRATSLGGRARVQQPQPQDEQLEREHVLRRHVRDEQHERARREEEGVAEHEVARHLGDEAQVVPVRDDEEDVEERGDHPRRPAVRRDEEAEGGEDDLAQPQAVAREDGASSHIASSLRHTTHGRVPFFYRRRGRREVANYEYAPSDFASSESASDSAPSEPASEPASESV